MAKTCGEKLFFNTFVMKFAENAIPASTILISPVISPCERSQACAAENDFGAKPLVGLAPRCENYEKYELLWILCNCLVALNNLTINDIGDSCSSCHSCAICDNRETSICWRNPIDRFSGIIYKDSL